MKYMLTSFLFLILAEYRLKEKILEVHNHYYSSVIMSWINDGESYSIRIAPTKRRHCYLIVSDVIKIVAKSVEDDAAVFLNGEEEIVLSKSDSRGRWRVYIEGNVLSGGDDMGLSNHHYYLSCLSM